MKIKDKRQCTSLIVKCFVLLFAASTSRAGASLYSIFDHYEILKPSHIKVRVKRDFATNRIHSKQVSFFGLGKAFHLHLKPGSPVIDPVNFEAKTIDAKGNSRHIHIRYDNFYTGIVNGDSTSAVDASYIGGVWSAQIETDQEYFSIEPLSKYDRFGYKRAMIFFRNNGVKTHNATGPFGDLVRNPCRSGNFQKFNFVLAKKHQVREDIGNQRTKRHSQINSICDIIAVMDTLTFQDLGMSSPRRSAAMIIYWYQLVERIYRNTDFLDFSNVTIQLSSLLILKEYTSVDGESFTFNIHPKEKRFTPEEFLQRITNEHIFNNYCLSHVTTQRIMDANILGLAILANDPSYEAPFWKGGICASQVFKPTNVGFSNVGSSQGFYTDALYLVILAHELGHGWGALHDPPECQPRDDEGGKYLMFARVNGARTANNFQFSICSKRDISAVLMYKSHLCLLPAQAVRKLCGNYQVEFPEECDEGPVEKHSCCTQNCRLRRDARCSPTGFPCCTESCQVAPSTQSCHNLKQTQCYGESFCDGINYHICPQPSPLPNGAVCGDNGTCWYGECSSYCRNLSRSFHPPVQFLPCPCTDRNPLLCGKCCPAPDTECGPNGDTTKCNIYPCIDGYCQKPPVTNKIRQYALRRTFFIRHLVMIVIVVTLLPYLLLVAIVEHIDAKNKRPPSSAVVKPKSQFNKASISTEDTWTEDTWTEDTWTESTIKERTLPKTVKFQV